MTPNRALLLSEAKDRETGGYPLPRLPRGRARAGEAGATREAGQGATTVEGTIYEGRTVSESADREISPKGGINLDNAFLCYATLGADPIQTAHALNVTPRAVMDMAAAHHWDEKLKAIIALKKSSAPGDVERSVNRAIAFSAAHRLRLFIERVISRLSDMTPTELERYILQDEYQPKTGTTKSTLSTRAICDLAAALDKVNATIFQALADTGADRARREEAGGESDSAGKIHCAIAAAMSEIAGEESTTAGLLFNAQMAASAVQATRVRTKSITNSDGKRVTNSDESEVTNSDESEVTNLEESAPEN